jgi:xanthine dehydrogenase YagT iron-sulfur-binding subunit
MDILTQESRSSAGVAGSQRNLTLPLTLHVNGQERELRVPPSVTLLDLLREQLRLTGAKKGCDHGQCGACTVLVNGKRINSCLKLAVTLDGASITTIEGIGGDGGLDPLQQAFIERDAFQCGYCTPGQICSAKALLDENVAHTRDEVREWMSGNLCRCGAYSNITDAVMDVMQARTGEQR